MNLLYNKATKGQVWYAEEIVTKNASSKRVRKVRPWLILSDGPMASNCMYLAIALSTSENAYNKPTTLSLERDSRGIYKSILLGQPRIVENLQLTSYQYTYNSAVVDKVILEWLKFNGLYDVVGKEEQIESDFIETMNAFSTPGGQYGDNVVLDDDQLDPVQIHNNTASRLQANNIIVPGCSHEDKLQGPLSAPIKVPSVTPPNTAAEPKNKNMDTSSSPKKLPEAVIKIIKIYIKGGCKDSKGFSQKARLSEPDFKIAVEGFVKANPYKYAKRNALSSANAYFYLKGSELDPLRNIRWRGGMNKYTYEELKVLYNRYSNVSKEQAATDLAILPSTWSNYKRMIEQHIEEYDAAAKKQEVNK